MKKVEKQNRDKGNGTPVTLPFVTMTTLTQGYSQEKGLEGCAVCDEEEGKDLDDWEHGLR